WSPSSSTTAWPKRLTSVNSSSAPSSSRNRARTWLGSGSDSYTRGPSNGSVFIRSAVAPPPGSRIKRFPVIRRCRAALTPPRAPISGYWPRRATAVTSRPATARSTELGGSGRVSRSSITETDSIRFPTSSGSSWRRTVSTSGNSGMPQKLLSEMRPWVGLEVGLLELLPGEVRVELGGRQIGVPEHLLDRAEVATAGEQVSRKRVPQGVRAHPVAEARGLRVAQDDLVQTLPGQRTTPEVDEELPLLWDPHEPAARRPQLHP